MVNRIYGNRVTEKDIRSWLENHDFRGRSAKFDEIELHAVQRPGWVQLFRFSASALDNAGNSKRIFGCVLDDERKSCGIWVFENINLQRAKLISLSDGMIIQNTVLKNGHQRDLTAAGPVQLIFFVLGVVTISFLVALASRFTGI